MKTKRFLAFAFSLALFAGSADFSLLHAQQRRDALVSYRQGRDFEARGRTEDARRAYSEAIEICLQDLQVNSRNMDAYTIYCWSLVRLNRWQEAIDTGRAALAIRDDPRIVESMGEAYFYLDNYAASLRNMQSYADTLPNGDRISTAYFFMAEIYRLTARYNLAEFAYTAAVYHEPDIALWWYRLGTVREEIGDNSGAEAAYTRATRLQPGFRDTAERLRRVRARIQT